MRVNSSCLLIEVLVVPEVAMLVRFVVEAVVELEYDRPLQYRIAKINSILKLFV